MMIILAHYRLKFNQEEECFECIPLIDGFPICPHCAQHLKYRDCRLRVCKRYGGEKCWILIRRLYCPECHRMHNELPDFLVPYKHYAAKEIEDVLDEAVTADDTAAENFPCEATMERWKGWLSRNAVNMDGLLKQLGVKIMGLREELLESGISPLARLRENGSGWLPAILHMIYNAGHFLPA